MHTCSSLGISTIKPCRILIGFKSSSMFGTIASPKLKYKRIGRFSKLEPNGCKVIGSVQVVDKLSRRCFCFSNGYRLYKGSSDRNRHLIANVASDFRNQSTSAESYVKQKSFDAIYINGGFKVKPLEIESIETGHDIVKEDKKVSEVEGLGSLKGSNYSRVERELSKIEKEAWDLLRNSVVFYCGHPVGTVAANDPADAQPLNYDQVFVRDFVPSALAFLLNGEEEIVKNFLLHTLQLQVYSDTSSFLFMSMVVPIFYMDT